MKLQTAQFSLKGTPFAALKSTRGELVFNTAMSGYEEVLTDPSYAGQIIVFSYPHIGNTGINKEDVESKEIYAKGVIVRDYVKNHSHYQAKTSLGEWLKAAGIPGISGVDTRALTRLIRDQGSLEAQILYGEEAEIGSPWPNRTEKSWLNENRSGPLFIVLDFGVKQSILNCLGNQSVLLMPADSPLSEILDLDPAAVIISNGPGDPASHLEAIKLIRSLCETKIPLLGICLGCQLLALALGAQTEKLRFGHHGINHPVRDLRTNRVFITSQNHNYVVTEASLPNTVSISHRSLFDGSVQGFVHREQLIVAFQGHPEAGPGPRDLHNLIKQFIEKVNYHAEA